MDHLLRLSDDKYPLEEFIEVIDKVSTPVLLQVMKHFKERPITQELRTFFPKGSIAKTYAIPDTRPPVIRDLCITAATLCEDALVDRFKVLKPLGKVYADDWSYLEHISYTNLRSAKYRAVHSGDITSAPNGACEFIDLDINSIIRYGGRYVIMSVNSFSMHPYCDLPECFAGWMMRQAPQSGEIFEPKTVTDKIDLTADTKICIPVIIDLIERTIIWTDLALKANPYWHNNVEGNKRGMVVIGKSMTTLVKPTLYELFELHARARGELVLTPDTVDTVFSLNEGITPFDIDVIMAQYL